MTEAREVSVQNQEVSRPESYFVPATDIYETEDELVLVADMPGVRPDGLEVTVEDNVLTMHGRPPAHEGEGEALLEEFQTGDYYRSFQLPADFDTQNVDATLRSGVLTLRLAKSERMKPRRIEVKAE